ncbi:MAG: hypothetical protein AB7G06_04880 [Bdellovibrionales bacterium]
MADTNGPTVVSLASASLQRQGANAQQNLLTLLTTCYETPALFCVALQQSQLALGHLYMLKVAELVGAAPIALQQWADPRSPHRPPPRSVMVQVAAAVGVVLECMAKGETPDHYELTSRVNQRVSEKLNF